MCSVCVNDCWCSCLLCEVYDRALEGSADALLGHWRLPPINTSINNNQSSGWVERLVYMSAELNYAAGSGNSPLWLPGWHLICSESWDWRDRSNSALLCYCVTLYLLVCPLCFPASLHYSCPLSLCVWWKICCSQCFFFFFFFQWWSWQSLVPD